MADENSMVFYPGSGNDIVPLLIKNLTQDREDALHEFIYCDPANQIQTFFKRLANRKGESLGLNQLADLNPQYRAFILNLELDSLTIQQAKNNTPGDSALSFEFNVSYSSGETKSTTLHFFPTKAETYLDELHSKHFTGREIDTVLHITQISSTQRRSKNLFNPENFLELLNNNATLRSVKYVITDNPDLYTDTKYSPQSSKIFTGWGYSGNSLVSKQSARVLAAEPVKNKSGQSAAQKATANQSEQDEKLDSIRKKLGEMKFEW